MAYLLDIVLVRCVRGHVEGRAEGRVDSNLNGRTPHLLHRHLAVLVGTCLLVIERLDGAVLVFFVLLLCIRRACGRHASVVRHVPSVHDRDRVLRASSCDVGVAAWQTKSMCVRVCPWLCEFMAAYENVHESHAWLQSRLRIGAIPEYGTPKQYKTRLAVAALTRRLQLLWPFSSDVCLLS